MAINLAEKYSSNVDEVMKKGALTNGAVNQNYDFVGAKTVKVYGMGTAKMNDYKPTGTDRYGTPEELDDTTQELTLSRMRSFTFTIDATNRVDSPEGVRDAAKALRRQIDQVIIPEIDSYRLTKAAENAGTKMVGGAERSVAFSTFLKLTEALDNAEVPGRGAVAFCTPWFINNLKSSDEFIKSSEMSQEMLIKGQIGEADGIAIIKTPVSRMPAGASCLISHSMAMPAPTKLAEYKIHDNPPGVAGHLVEGLIYYDAFVLNNKKNAVAVLFGELGELKAEMTAADTGKGKVTVKGNFAGKLMYKAGASVTAPKLGDDISKWTELPDDGIITAAGNKVAIAAGVNGEAVAAAVLDAVVGA